MRSGEKNSPDFLLEASCYFVSPTSCLNVSSFNKFLAWTSRILLLITLYPYLGVLVPVVCRRHFFCFESTPFSCLLLGNS